MTAKRREIVAICVMFAMVHAFNSLYNTFMPLFLADLSFTASERGILLSIGALTSMLFQTMWGSFADRAKSKVNVMRVLSTGLIFVMALFLIAGSPVVSNAAIAVHSFIKTNVFHNIGDGGLEFFLENKTLIITALALMLYAFFQNPMLPLIDTISMEYIEEKKPRIKYGVIRTMGTASFVVVAYVVGILIDRSAKGTEMIFMVYLAFIIVLLFSLQGIPPIKGMMRKKEKRQPAISLFRDKWFTVMVVSALVISIAYGFNTSNFSNYLRDQLGAGESVIGINSALGSTLEIFLFIVIHRITKKTGIINLIMICLIAASARWFATSLTTSIPLLIIVQFFTQPFTWGILVYAIAIYIQKAIPPELHATGQAVMNMVMFSIGRVVGSLAGGYVLDLVGAENIRMIYLAFSVICFAATAIAALKFRSFGWRINRTPPELRLDENSVI